MLAVVDNAVFLPLTVSGYRDRQNAILATWGKRIKHLQWLDWENGFAHISTDLLNLLAGTSDKVLDIQKEWFVFCDDDSYLFVGRLMKFLKQCDGFHLDRPVCFGKIIQLRGRPEVCYPSGVCYVLSHSAVLRLRTFLKESPGTERYHIHDVSMGMWCSVAGVNMIDIPGLYGTNPWNLDHSDETIYQAVAYNHVDPRQMSLLESYND